MKMRIALSGNQNSGKTTLFNFLTGSNQYVGNWPGVTVEKKEGYLKNDPDIQIIDLPGIYSLSPYTLEEVVTREYLLEEKPDVIIDVLDASNLERNLYLATQLSEIGIPIVLAFNMMDKVRKSNIKINTGYISKELGIPIVEISAARGENIDELIRVAKAQNKADTDHIHSYSKDFERKLIEIENSIASLKDKKSKRWYSTKLVEDDEKAIKDLEIKEDEREKVNVIINDLLKTYDDDDGESIIIDQRYKYITDVVSRAVKKEDNFESTTEKIDKIATNRYLAIPLFILIIFGIYYIAIGLVNDKLGPIWADGFLGETVPSYARSFLESIGTSEFLTNLLVDGVIAGVGSVLGFLPLVASLELLIAFLEDVGYMSRIAFILDRFFRKFGLSGKSFIPLVIGTGCSVPGIMSTRTIENDNDRRMTIMVTSFMPCGAKVDIIAMFAAAIFGQWWFAPSFYFIGIIAVLISGLILKKTSAFSGDSTPFVMELPEYHLPVLSNIAMTTWHRVVSFVKRAGSIILVSSIAIWFLQNISTDLHLMDFTQDSSKSILAFIGSIFSPIFKPLGFGDWMATTASFLGLVAKEVVVSVYAIITSSNGDAGLYEAVRSNFTTVSAMSFLIFNQLCVPCFAAVGAIREEMNSKKWTAFTLLYQFTFAYTMSFMVYQFGRIFILKEAANLATLLAGLVFIGYIYLIFRKDKSKLKVGKSNLQDHKE
ncbi:MAG: ferrous iron transport protein B [Finegoldia sp.]|nr:ferrous iron transport protein B [Finegoldia sp.]